MLANSRAFAMAGTNRLFLRRTLRSCSFYFGALDEGAARNSTGGNATAG